MRYDAVMAETIRFSGYEGEWIEGYFARPLAAGPHPGVIVIHHRPGYDEATKEIARRFATAGYLALCPNLHYREAPDGSPDDAASIVRAEGGVPDERCVGDVAGAVSYLRENVSANGRVGVVGYCSGGRQAYIVGARIAVDAVVVCYGGNIVSPPEAATERMPVPPIAMTAEMGAPVLGLFGADDKNPSPEIVAVIDQALEHHGKLHDFTIFENAGHGFFATDRASYRPVAANEGWQRIFRWFDIHLADGHV